MVQFKNRTNLDFNNREKIFTFSFLKKSLTFKDFVTFT